MARTGWVNKFALKYKPGTVPADFALRGWLDAHEARWGDVPESEWPETLRDAFVQWGEMLRNRVDSGTITRAIRAASAPPVPDSFVYEWTPIPGLAPIRLTGQKAVAKLREDAEKKMRELRQSMPLVPAPRPKPTSPRFLEPAKKVRLNPRNHDRNRPLPDDMSKYYIHPDDVEEFKARGFTIAQGWDGERSERTSWHLRRDGSSLGSSPTFIQRTPTDGPVLSGHFALWDQRTLIDNPWEGTYYESFRSGSWRKTLKDRTPVVLFQHGRESAGDKPLGKVLEAREDDMGAFFRIALFDAPYVNELLPALESGVMGASFAFRSIRENLNEHPRPTADNPDGIPSRELLEVAVREVSVVTFPAYPQTQGMVGIETAEA